MIKENFKDRLWLSNRYVDALKTSVEIAEECKVTPPTIRYWLHKLKIPVRVTGSYRHLDSKYRDREYLYDEYIVKHKGTQLIADELGVGKSTINRWLIKFEILLRPNTEAQLVALENGRFPEGHFKKIRVKSNGMKGHKHFEGSIKKISENRKGKCMGIDHPHWNGGSSFELYGSEFNEELKEQIRNRDNYICQECDKTQKELGCKLSVHHIDYDKTNNKPENLISLCKFCHGKTNFKRDDWIMYLKNKLESVENYDYTRT